MNSASFIGSDRAALSYVTVLNENDVLLGRGQPILNYPGNLGFRKLIVANKAAYTASGKHAVKDEIARRILRQIAAAGGRFLRKTEDDSEEQQQPGISPSVQQVWVIVDEETRLQKVKQALREQVCKPDAAPTKGTSSAPASKKSGGLAASGSKNHNRKSPVHLEGSELSAAQRNLPPRKRKAEVEDEGRERKAVPLQRAVSAPGQQRRSLSPRKRKSPGVNEGIQSPGPAPLYRSPSLPLAFHNSNAALQQQQQLTVRPGAVANSSDASALEGLDLLVRMKNRSITELDWLIHREQALAFFQQVRSGHTYLGGGNAFPVPPARSNFSMRDLLSIRSGSLSDLLLQQQQPVYQTVQPPPPISFGSAGVANHNHDIFDNNLSLFASMRGPPTAGGGYNEAVLMQQCHLLAEQEARLNQQWSQITTTATEDGELHPLPAGTGTEKEAAPSPGDSKPKAIKKTKKKKKGNDSSVL
jgi:hypothetical protein